MSAMLNPEGFDTWIDELYGVDDDDDEPELVDEPGQTPVFLSLGPAPGPWRLQGRCRNSDTEDFYPGDFYKRGTPEYRKARDRAIATCNICPVRQDCLEFALENDVRSGIWGGLTEPARRKIRYPKPKVEAV